MTRQALTALAAGLASLVAAASAGASVRLTTDPTLRPAFGPEVSDYVSRCVPDEPLHFDVEATGGDRVAVGGHPARGGRFGVDVSRAVGDAVSVRVRSGGRRSTHHVRCLPRGFPDWQARRFRKPQARWYVITPTGPWHHGYVAIFDDRGVPVWWRYVGAHRPWDPKLLANGDVLWSRDYFDRFGVRPQDAAEEHRLDGTLVRTIRTVNSPTDMHDAVLMPNGDYLMDTYRRRARRVDLRPYGGPRDALVYDAEIQELSPDGELVWSWSSRDHIRLSETRWWRRIVNHPSPYPRGEPVYDIVHINSVEPDGDGIVISARHLDAVYRIDRRSGRIDWKLGGTHRPESLTVVGDPRSPRPLDGNHDARVFGRDSVTVHDNGTRTRRRPRALRYRIDAAKRTATLVEQLEPDAYTYSGWGGSARKLPTGNWVHFWGGGRRMVEATPQNRTVLELSFPKGLTSYRAFPVPRGELPPTTLRRAMTALARNGMAAPAR